MNVGISRHFIPSLLLKYSIFCDFSYFYRSPRHLTLHCLKMGKTKNANFYISRAILFRVLIPNRSLIIQWTSIISVFTDCFELNPVLLLLNFIGKHSWNMNWRHPVVYEKKQNKKKSKLDKIFRKKVVTLFNVQILKLFVFVFFYSRRKSWTIWNDHQHRSLIENIKKFFAHKI